MARMGEATVARLRVAVASPVVVARYWEHVQVRAPLACWPWTGAISGHGHGRFQIADEYVIVDGERKRRTFVVIAHRFGFALVKGVDELLAVPLLAHSCDNPLCQNAAHWRESNPSANRREYYRRRGVVGGALADVRGARGRAREVRQAARDGSDVADAELAGASEVHRHQQPLFDEPVRVYTDDGRDRLPGPRPLPDGVSGLGGDQAALFPLDS